MATPKKKISAMLTAVVLLFSLVAVGIVWFPSILGYKAYAIETGSMAPIIPEGSMVYVKPCSNFEDYQVNDVVTFTDDIKNQSFTHRIVAIDKDDYLFTTKGDTNEIEDLEPTSASLAVGKVKMAIPLLGYVASALKHTAVKIIIAVFYVAWAAIEIELFLTERKKRYD